MESVRPPAVPPERPTRSQAAQHLSYLDGLRAVAALYVVFFHVLLQFRDGPYDLREVQLFRVFSLGHYAVDVFIVLSGYCLMLPVVRHGGELRGGAWKFFKRRALRILPPYYFALLLSLALIATLVGGKTHTHWDTSLPVSRKSILSHLVLLHDAVGQNSTINHVFWSIAVEWRIYLFFPLLVLAWRRLGAGVTTALSIVGSIAVAYGLRARIGEDLTAYYFGLFALGMLAASFTQNAKFARWRSWPWGVVSLVLGVLLIYPNQYVAAWYGTVRLSLLDTAVGVWTFATLVWLAQGDNWGRKMLSFPPLVWVGTFAYSIYLIHAPLIQVLWQYPFARLQTAPALICLAFTLLGVPLIVAASYGFFLVCERPFLRKRVAAQPDAIVVKTTLEPAP